MISLAYHKDSKQGNQLVWPHLKFRNPFKNETRRNKLSQLCSLEKCLVYFGCFFWTLENFGDNQSCKFSLLLLIQKDPSSYSVSLKKT